MYASLLLLGLGLISANGDSLDRQQIRDLLRQLRAPIRDYECLYEGQEKRIRAPDLTGWPDPIRKATERDRSFDAGAITTYQGTYAYRDDISIHIDVSIHPPDPKMPLRREILCLFHGMGSKRVIIPDKGGTTGPDIKQPAGTIFVKKTYSQLRLDMYPYLMETILNSTVACQSPGWDPIDGHRCLVIDFPRLDEENGKRIWGERYWVDVARGGAVLKYEWDDDGSVSSRLTDVALIREPVAGGEFAWLPVSGRSNFFRDGVRASTSVQVEHAYGVIRGTLKINTKLPDSRYTLDYRLDEGARESARALNKAKSRNSKGIPSDAETSTKLMLRDPDNASMRLVASSPSSASWFQRNGVSAVFLAGGIILIGTGFYLKRMFG